MRQGAPVINIHIDRIVLRGGDIDPDRAEIFGSSLSSELERILVQDGLAGGLADSKISSISAPSFEAPRTGGERQLAGSLARSIHRSLSGLGR